MDSLNDIAAHLQSGRVGYSDWASLRSVLVIDPVQSRRRALCRTLIASGLLVQGTDRLAEPTDAALLLLHLGPARLGDPETSDAILDARTFSAPHTQMAVIADLDDPKLAALALHLGFRGYVPSNLPATLVVAAVNLLLAGGLFASAHSITTHFGTSPIRLRPSPDPAVKFTSREDEVLTALQQGKPNKIIALELSIAESTVKIHVRNIMRKLKATNRTQIVVLSRHQEADPAPFQGCI